MSTHSHMLRVCPEVVVFLSQPHAQHCFLGRWTRNALDAYSRAELTNLVSEQPLRGLSVGRCAPKNVCDSGADAVPRLGYRESKR